VKRALLAMLWLSGCAAAPATVTRIVTITPAVPASLMQCAAAPDVPVVKSQAGVALYIVALWQAGQDCRAHLAAIKVAMTK